MRIEYVQSTWTQSREEFQLQSGNTYAFEPDDEGRRFAEVGVAEDVDYFLAIRDMWGRPCFVAVEPQLTPPKPRRRAASAPVTDMLTEAVPEPVSGDAPAEPDVTETPTGLLN